MITHITLAKQFAKQRKRCSEVLNLDLYSHINVECYCGYSLWSKMAAIAQERMFRPFHKININGSSVFFLSNLDNPLIGPE